MSFTLYGVTFVDGVTVVPAAFLNKLRTEMPSAVDGRGGSYTNTSLLKHTTSGAGFTIDGDGLITISSTGGLTISSAINGSITYASSSVSAWVDIGRGVAAASAWLYQSASPDMVTAPQWVQQAVDRDFVIPLDLPVGSVITTASVRVDGNAGGWPVGNLPAIEVVYQTLSSTTLTSLGTQADTSGSQAAYNANHAITLTGLSETVNTNRRYWLRVQGEGGIFAAGDLQLTGCTVGLTITSQSKWYG